MDEYEHLRGCASVSFQLACGDFENRILTSVLFELEVVQKNFNIIGVKPKSAK